MLNKLLSAVPKRPNLVVNDPKGTLLKHMYANLRKQNYNIKVLDIMNMYNGDPASNCYNPLLLPTKEAVQGNYSYATESLERIAHILVSTAQGQQRFFYSSARMLFVASVFLVIAHVYKSYHDKNSKDYHNNEIWTQVNLYNVINMIDILGKAKVGKDSSELLHKSHILQEELKHSRNKQLTFCQRRYYHIIQGALCFLDTITIAYFSSRTYSSIIGILQSSLPILKMQMMAIATSNNDINLNKLDYNHLLSIYFSPKQNYKSVSVRLYDDKSGEKEFYKQKIQTHNNELDVPINQIISRGMALKHEITIKITAHTHKFYNSKTTILGYNPKTRDISITQNNANVQKCHMIDDARPQAIFIKSLPEGYKMNKLGTILIDQAIYNAVKYPLEHNCFKQRDTYYILNHTEALYGLMPNLTDLIDEVARDHHLHLLLAVPSLNYFYEKISDNTKKFMLKLKYDCPDELDNKQGHFIATGNDLFQMIGLLTRLYQRPVYPERLLKIKAINLKTSTIPKITDWQKQYDQLNKQYQDYVITHQPKPRNNQLILTDNFVEAKTKSQYFTHEYTWGLVINASEDTKITLTKQKVDQDKRLNKHIKGIQVLFNPKQAIPYKNQYLVQLKDIIAVR